MERPQAIEDIFDAARVIESAEQRDAYLRVVCGENRELRKTVESLLAADVAAGDFLRTTDTRNSAIPPGAETTDTAETFNEARIGERPGSIIGNYKLIDQIGEGGFGVVFLAEQLCPVSRRVALKIVKQGMDTRRVLARFEQERQSLAMMDHPLIARVFDAGVTESGRPYFVMEYVEGTPITTYADERQLTVRERLELFCHVCHAVQYAHQKGIIHRDIKPSNVLTTVIDDRPSPKIIDFGIAKATDPKQAEQMMFTQEGQLVGTPQYMSPEQAEFGGKDIDTRSDVYSLGVLLYELLVGTTPIDPETFRTANISDMPRLIREHETPRPSTKVAILESLPTVAALRRAEPRKLGMMLRGDLDWIVLKALEKDRTRRYDTAIALSDDIRRHLEHEPVTACPPSTAYRLRKFIRKNKAPVAAITAVMIALLAGVAATSIALQSALRAKDELALAYDSLEQVAEFQAAQLSAIDPQAMGVTLRTSLISGIETALADAPMSVEQREQAITDLHSILGWADFTTLAREALEDSVFDGAIAAIDSRFSDDPPLRARLLDSLASTLYGLGIYDRAEHLHRTALDVRRAHLGDVHVDALRSMESLAVLLRERGQLEEAEELHLRVAAIAQRTLDRDHELALKTMGNLASLRMSQGRLDEAENLMREWIARLARVYGDDHIFTLNARSNLGALLLNAGQFDEAERLLRKHVEGMLDALGPHHHEALAAKYNFGLVLRQLGRLDEAEQYMRRAADGLRQTFGNAHPRTLVAINGLAAILDAQGRLDEVLPLVDEANRGLRVVLGDYNLHTIASIANVGIVHRRMEQYDESEVYLQEAIDLAKQRFGEGNYLVGHIMMEYSRTLSAMARIDDAFATLESAYGILHSALGPDHPTTIECAGLISEVESELASTP